MKKRIFCLLLALMTSVCTLAGAAEAPLMRDMKSQEIVADTVLGIHPGDTCEHAGIRMRRLTRSGQVSAAKPTTFLLYCVSKKWPRPLF